MYDVIIIGGGPCGATAGTEAMSKATGTGMPDDANDSG